MPNHIVIRYILSALNDDAMAVAHLSGANSLKELKSRVSTYENHRRALVETRRSAAVGVPAAGPRNAVPQQQHGHAKPKPAIVPSTNTGRARMIQRDQVLCFNCSGSGHFAGECPQPPKPKKSVCFYCQAEGHMIANCPLKRQVAFVEDRAQPAIADWNAAIAQEEEELDEVQTVSVDWKLSNTGNFVSNRVRMNCLLDTGSPINLIRISKVPASVVNDQSLQPSRYSGIGKTPLSIYGTTIATVFFNHQAHEVEFLILPDSLLPTNLLVGRVFLKKFNIALTVRSPNNYSIVSTCWANLCQQLQMSKKHACEFFISFLNKIAPALCSEEKISVIHSIEKRDAPKKLKENIDRIYSVCSKSFIEACFRSVDKLQHATKESQGPNTYPLLQNEIIAHVAASLPDVENT